MARPRRKKAPRRVRLRPTLSVVLPAYNVASYLERCLDSLLTQAPEEGLELIVVDDGSPDECGAIAERRCAADPRIRVLRQANAGCAAARDAGLAAATGDYVGFVDPDDEVEPGWARTLLAAAGDRPAIVRGEARIFRDGHGQPPPLTCETMASHDRLHWLGCMWAAVYRRDFLSRHGLCFRAGLIFAEDLLFQMQALVTALTTGEEVALCPQAVYRYLRREGTANSARLSTAKVEGALICHQALHELLSEHAAQLPEAGLGCQYYLLIRNLFDIARRAEDPAAAPAAEQLARRLIMECPVPQALERMRQLQLSAAAARAQG